MNQGANATFTITVAGTPTLYYQWRYNAGNISGATLSSYTRSNCQNWDAGSYSCVVTNLYGSVTSADAVLTINAGSAGTYWDLNGTAAGAGTTPSGTWDTTSRNWSSSSAGSVATGTHTASTPAYFSAGTDATGAYTVTVSGTQSPQGLLVEEGSPTFTGGELDFVLNGTDASNYVASGITATFNTPFGGTTAPDKWGTGTAVYAGASTVSGSLGAFFTLNEGTIAIGNNSAFSTLYLQFGDPTGNNVVTLKSADSTAHTVANQIYFYCFNCTFGAGGDLTFSGPTDVGGNGFAPTIIKVSNTNTTFSGVLSDTAGIALDAASTGTFILSGASANTYGSTSANGNTTVSGGTLKLNKTAGVNAVPNGTLIVNGGTLLLGAANQIANTVPMTLGGGTFNTGGLSETLGTLAVTANSTTSLGANGILAYADSHAVAWTASKTNTITGWSGTLVTGGGTNQIKFGAASTALTSTQLGQVKFLNPAGKSAGTYNATILSTGEVIPQ